jgi:hypothetical protein
LSLLTRINLNIDGTGYFAYIAHPSMAADKNFLDKRPARLHTWMKGQVDLVDRFGPLPSDQANSIQLYAHVFRKVRGATTTCGQGGREVLLKSIDFKQLSQPKSMR